MNAAHSLIPGIPDPFMLLAACALPIAGALFALVMPGADRLALRYVGMGVAIAAAIASLRACWLAVSAPIILDVAGVRLSLDGLSAPMLASLGIASPVALRAGAARVLERTQFYVVTALFAHGLLAAALLVDAPLLRLGIAPIAAVPLFALVALFGGPQRGSTTLSAAMIWLLVDVAALAMITWLAAKAGVDVARASTDDLARAASACDAWEKPWIFIVLAAPGLVRLGAGPFSVWLASFLDEAPVSAAVLAAAGAAPLGAQLLLRIAVPTAPEGLVVLAPWIAGVGAVSVVLSGIIAIGERDLRRLLAQLLQAAGATAAVALLSLGDDALAAGTIHVVATGASAALALTAIESVERRFETRDVVELAGLGQSTPLLTVFVIASLLAMTGVPAFGAGTTLWASAAALVHAPSLVAAGLPAQASAWLAFVVAGGTVLASAGVAGAARRLLQPAPKKTRLLAIETLTTGQSLRLFFVAAFALVMGLAAASLVDIAKERARSIAATSRQRAGLVDVHESLFPHAEPRE